MASTYAVATVNYRALGTLVSDEGSAYANRQAEKIKVRAIAEAPVGKSRAPESHAPGNLKRSHFRNGVRMEGPYRAVGSVINNARYAAVVHQGYPGLIFPKGQHFKIPAVSMYGYRPSLMGVVRPNKDGYLRWKNPVRGQKGNDWLARAGAAVLRGI
jgi:hypothetical protein